MRRNKRAQSGLYVLIALAVFGLVYFTGLSALVNSIGEAALASGITGVDAWFYSNLNLVITFCYITAIALTVKYGF